MNNFDLRKFLSENKLTAESESSDGGLITFEQLKQACIENYTETTNNLSGDREMFDDEVERELNKATSINEIVDILEGVFHYDTGAYDFIFSSILK